MLEEIGIKGRKILVKSHLIQYIVSICAIRLHRNQAITSDGVEIPIYVLEIRFMRIVCRNFAFESHSRGEFFGAEHQIGNEKLKMKSNPHVHVLKRTQFEIELLMPVHILYLCKFSMEQQQRCQLPCNASLLLLQDWSPYVHERKNLGFKCRSKLLTGEWWPASARSVHS